MPSMTSSSLASPVSRPRPPRLNDASRYVKVDSIPIIDICERSYLKKDPKTGKEIRVDESIDKTQLKVILENSRHRSEKGELSPVFLGHTDDTSPEIEQPPIVGYLDNYQLGEHDGRPTILADVYIDKEDCDPSKTLRQFPRRSAEIIGIAKSSGYIDSVALLKRTPERSLGLVTSHYNKESEDIYRFECPTCEKTKMAKPSMAATMADHEARESHKKKKKDVVKNVLTLAQMLVDSIIEEQEEEKMHSSDSPETEEEELAMPATSRHAKVKEADDADMDTSSSSSSSEPSESSSSSSEPMMKKKDKKERSEPSRMDPSEPSRMSKKPKEKSKMAMGGGDSSAAASPPGPMTSTPSDPSESDEPSRMKKKSRMSHSNSERTRMSEDQDRIEVSRFRRIIESQDAQIKELNSRFAVIDQEKRSAIVERKLVQLVAEGYELDRAEEVSRFNKYFSDDAEVDAEISRMRKTYKQSPVGQQLIPSFSPDMGGANVPRQKSLHEIMQPHRDDNDPRNAASGINAPIIGSRFARMADAEGKTSVREPGGNRRGTVDLKDISRFILEKAASEK